MDEETKREFDKVWSKIREMESGEISQKAVKKRPTDKKTLRGLPAGIQALIDEGFLNVPKKVAEITEELKRLGYFAQRATIDRTVRRDFFKNKKILTRIKQGNVWKYVVRK